MSLEQRFWAKVDKRQPGDCWMWTASTFKTGYGKINGGARTLYAHRVSYELAFGPITDGLYVCHHCDVRLCVNPNHLFLGTSKDNAVDMVQKGRCNSRGLPGEAHGMTSLTNSQIKLMRAKYRHDRRGDGIKAAAEFGIGKGIYPPWTSRARGCIGGECGDSLEKQAVSRCCLVAP